MIRLLNNFDITAYNTFGIRTNAQKFFEFTETDELTVFLERIGLPEKYLIMGGGSNLLFDGDYKGLIIHPNIPGLVEEREDRNFVYLEAGAGLEWDELVRRSVKFGLGGLENLSLIPGNVGAAPVQNIGAYGVEVKDHIHCVRGIDLQTRQKVEFKNEECQFGYRDSIFKKELKNRIVVTTVVFMLDKYPEFNLEYGALKTEVEKRGEVNLENIRQAVISIRESKLPDPKVLGNAGSFFKNPVVDASVAKNITDHLGNVPNYPVAESDNVKLAAGWLIEQCGWKGYRKGDVGVHDKQALVLVNHGKASGKELAELARQIKTSVAEKFGVELEPEVNIIES